MAFGIRKSEIQEWKKSIDEGEIAFLTHYWLDDRFPNCKTVTKVGAKDMNDLACWGAKYQLKKDWIHVRNDGYSHFDLLGETQLKILLEEGLNEHLQKFGLLKK